MYQMILPVDGKREEGEGKEKREERERVVAWAVGEGG